MPGVGNVMLVDAGAALLPEGPGAVPLGVGVEDVAGGVAGAGAVV
jgi:hypothetical protein